METCSSSRKSRKTKKFFLKLGLTPYNPEQPLQGMELKKKKQKIFQHTGNLFRKNLQLKDVC